MGKIIKFIIIAFVALAILGAAAFWGLAGFFAPKDMEESLIPDAASQFFDINGRVISTTASEERRLPVAFDKIPKHLQQAFIAIEDNRFYEHGGIDFRGTARALWTNLRGGEVQGGSTITQQLAKNAFLSQERTITRKIKEAFIAKQLEERYTKDEILDMYLNRIYFGQEPTVSKVLLSITSASMFRTLIWQKPLLWQLFLKALTIIILLKIPKTVKHVRKSF